TGLANEYIKNKETPDDVEHVHPAISKITEDTHGIALFQEQLIQITKDFAGFDLVESDSLRKAIGKKLPEEMKKYKEKFIEGAKSLGNDEKLAEEIWEWMTAAANYSFNKCISGDTRIRKQNGKTVSIKQLYESGNKPKILSLDSDGRIRANQIKEVYYNGPKEVYTVTFNNRKKLKCTLD